MRPDPTAPQAPQGADAPTQSALSDVAEASCVNPRTAPELALWGHDLRAALSEVIGALRLIDAERLPAATKLQFARTAAASEALSLLLERALSLALDCGAVPHSPVLQTERLMANLKLRWTARLRDQGRQFQLLAAPDLPTTLGLDGALFERVMSNLLGNAAKYAPTGRVICRMGLLDDLTLQISVQDDGPGFSPQSLAFLNDYQTLPETPAARGTGLGLVIVREMVQAAGGVLDIRNRAEGGALAMVTLPLMPHQARDLEPINTSALPDLSHLRILLADDSPTHRALHQTLLTQMGAEVVLAKDGVETIGRIERESFDLAIIDIEMPYFNGLDVIRHIRAMAGGVADLPIIALTSHCRAEMAEKVNALGVEVMITKPVQGAPELGSAVLGAHQHSNLLPPRTAVLALADIQINGDQFANLLQMAGPLGAAKILAHIHDDLTHAERALIAAAHTKNWAEVRAQTHVLIALAGTAGAERLSHQVQALNLLAQNAQPDQGTFLTLLPQLLESLRELLNFITMKIKEHGART